MSRRRDPVRHDLRELVRRHVGVRGHDDLQDGLVAARKSALHVALEQRGERLLGFPFRMLRRERLHAVQREEQLEVHRLLGPQRAVVVERGDALRHGDEALRALLRHLADKCDDRLL